MVVFEDASNSGNSFKTGAILGVSESFRKMAHELLKTAEDAAVSSPGFPGRDEAAGNCPKAA